MKNWILVTPSTTGKAELVNLEALERIRPADPEKGTKTTLVFREDGSTEPIEEDFLTIHNRIAFYSLLLV